MPLPYNESQTSLEQRNFEETMRNQPNSSNSEHPQPQIEKQLLEGGHPNIGTLSTKVQLSEQQLQSMVQNQSLSKVVERVIQYNETAVQLFEQQALEEGSAYLIEAEKILECLGGKDKPVDRKIVIYTLHNLACYYQKTWQLEECSNYLEALIFNLNNIDATSSNEFTPVSSNSDFHSRHAKVAPFQNISQKAADLLISIETKQRLGQYYLQFCAVNSQLENHSGAVVAARKAIQAIKKCFKNIALLLKYHNKNVNRQSKEEFESKLKLVHQISKINDNISVNQYDMVLETTKFYLKKWLNAGNSYSQRQQPTETSFLPGWCLPENFDSLSQKFKNFSIGSITQIAPLQNINQLFNVSQEAIRITISSESIVERILTGVICYFSISTELRQIAESQLTSDEKRGIEEIERQKQQMRSDFREAQLFHLFSVMLISIFIPFPQTLMMKHILSSYRNHYGEHKLDEALSNVRSQNPFDFTSADDKMYEEFLFTISDIKKPSLLSLDFEDSLRISEMGRELVICQGGGGTQIRLTVDPNDEGKKRFSMIDQYGNNQSEKSNEGFTDKKKSKLKSNRKSKSKSHSKQKQKKSSCSKSKKKQKKSTLKTISALSTFSKTHKKEKTSITSPKLYQIHTQSSLGRKDKSKGVGKQSQSSKIKSRSKSRSKSSKKSNILFVTSRSKKNKSHIREQSQFMSGVDKGKTFCKNTIENTNAYFLNKKDYRNTTHKKETTSKSKSKSKSKSRGKQMIMNEHYRINSGMSKKEHSKQAIQSKGSKKVKQKMSSPTQIYFHHAMGIDSRFSKKSEGMAQFAKAHHVH